MAATPPPLNSVDRERVRFVTARLRRAADPTGFLPFDRFMEIALYAEDGGYYTRAFSPLGAPGDFYTAAHVDPLFGESLANRIREIYGKVNDPGRFSVVEVGPGDGTLAAQVVRALAPDGVLAEYVLIDRSAARSREAATRLDGLHLPTPVRTAASIAALGPFTGVVVANELLDAQPARRLQWHAGTWRELGIRVEGDRVVAAVGGPAAPIPGPPLPAHPVDDLVVEVSPVAEGLVREISDHLAEGAAVVIDFGQEEAELLRAHPDGTLAGVRAHRFSSDPYSAPGTSDLSMFVNFSRIRSVARASGLQELSFRSQAEALGAWGLERLRALALDAAPDSTERVRRQLAVKSLLFGFERFRVLELAPAPTAARLSSTT